MTVVQTMLERQGGRSLKLSICWKTMAMHLCNASDLHTLSQQSMCVGVSIRGACWGFFFSK